MEANNEITIEGEATMETVNANIVCDGEHIWHENSPRAPVEEVKMALNSIEAGADEVAFDTFTIEHKGGRGREYHSIRVHLGSHSRAMPIEDDRGGLRDLIELFE